MNEAEERAGLASTPGYRYADVVGDQLFVAGQVPLDGAGAIVGLGDAARQAMACLDNLAVVIRLNGFGLDDIHQIVIYVVGEHADLIGAWQATVRWFDNNVPPATLLGVNLLGYRDQLVEVDATIARGGTATT